MLTTSRLKAVLGSSLAVLALAAPPCYGQSTQIATEYVMTLYAPLDAPQQIDATLFIYNVREGGWVKGPKINGTMIQPGADWLRVMPGGSLRTDIRATIKTDDGALIYITYNGIISHTQQSFDRLMKGETLTSSDHYFITAPIMETSSEKYSWLNRTQFIGKVVSVKLGEGSYVKYDIYAVQ